MLVINEDDSHFFGTRKPEDMTLDGLHAFVDQYANSAVTHLFLCPNAMRASFRSATRDAIWDPVAGVEPQDLWPQNGKRLVCGRARPVRDLDQPLPREERLAVVVHADERRPQRGRSRITSCTRRSGASILSTGACRTVPPLRG